MASTLSLISVILMVASGVFFLAAVFFFLFFNIPSVISDLTGRTAKRSVNRLRAANEKSASKFYGSSDRNKERGKITDKIEKKDAPSREDKKKEKAGVKKNLVFASTDDRPETGMLNENRAGGVTEDTGTMTLSADGTTDELVPSEETMTGTMELTPDIKEAPKPKKREGGMKLSTLDEVILIHTDEVIP